MAHAASLREELSAGYTCTRLLQNTGEPAASLQK
jgi:hypothetical protein